MVWILKNTFIHMALRQIKKKPSCFSINPSPVMNHGCDTGYLWCFLGFAGFQSRSKEHLYKGESRRHSCFLIFFYVCNLLDTTGPKVTYGSSWPSLPRRARRCPHPPPPRSWQCRCRLLCPRTWHCLSAARCRWLWGNGHDVNKGKRLGDGVPRSWTKLLEGIKPLMLWFDCSSLWRILLNTTHLWRVVLVRVMLCKIKRVPCVQVPAENTWKHTCTRRKSDSLLRRKEPLIHVDWAVI